MTIGGGNTPTPGTFTPRSSVANEVVELNFAHGIFADIHSTAGLRAAPDGAATLNTFGCVGSEGGLFPGPRATTSVSAASLASLYGGGNITQPAYRPPYAGGETYGAGRTYLVDGLVMSPITVGADEGADSPSAIYSSRYAAAGDGVANGYASKYTLFRAIAARRLGTSIFLSFPSGGGTTPATANHIVGPGSLTVFQADPTAYPAAAVRLPTLVGLVGRDDRTFVLGTAPTPRTYYFAFPDGSAPTTNNILNDDGTTRRYIFSHQGTLVCITNNSTTGAYGATATSLSGEAVIYGDYGDAENVPNTALTYFAEENPSGYGSWASLNANELLLVKHRGGGVLVRGAIANPTVIRLPNIHSTHGYPNIGAAVPGLGYVYFSALGAFAWNGQDTTSAVATQLPPKFWVSTRGDWAPDSNSSGYGSIGLKATPYGVAGLIGRATYCEPYLFAPNGYMLDTRTGGWWRVEDLDPTIPALTHWDTSAVDARVWGFRDYIDDTHLQSSQCFDVDKGATTYLYESQPLTPSRDRRIEVREIQIAVSGTTGSVIVVTLTGIAGADGTTSTQSESLALTSSGVSLFRISTALTAAQVQVQIAATSNDANTAAPRVLSFRLVYSRQTQL